MTTNNRTATSIDAFVGARLKAMRKSAKWSQTELADKIGVTFQQVQKYEKGTNRIGASRLWSLCQVLDVNVGHFFEGIHPPLNNSHNQLDSKAAPTPANDGNQTQIVQFDRDIAS